MSILNTLNIDNVFTIDSYAPSYPDLTGVKERNFLAGIIRKIRAQGYDSPAALDQRIRKGMAKLYWLIYSSGDFSFNTDTPLTSEDVVSRGWVSEKDGGINLATTLLVGLQRYGLLGVTDDNGTLLYRLNYNFITKDNTKTLQKRDAAVARRRHEQAVATFPHLSDAVAQRIETSAIHPKDKENEPRIRYLAKHMLSTIIEYGVISHETYSAWSRRALVDAFRRLTGNPKNRVGIFAEGNIPNVVRHLVRSGLLTTRQKHVKAAFEYKLTFVPPVIRTMPLPKVEVPKVAPLPQPASQIQQQEPKPTPPRVEVIVQPPTDITNILNAINTFKLSICQQIDGLKAQIVAEHIG